MKKAEEIKDAVVFLLFTYPFGIFIGISFWLFKSLGIAKVYGRKNFPVWQGNVLLISNHPSLLEPIILIALFFPQYLWRPFTYAPWNMAESKNYGNMLFYFMRPRLILVDRDDKRSKTEGIILAKNILNSGGVIILFPEGGRTSSGENFLESAKGKKIRNFKPGFAWLAAETGATVLPVWVEGTDNVLPNRGKVSYFYFFKFWKKIVIKLGKPFHVDKDAKTEIIIKQAESAILTLADQESEGD